MASKVPGTNLTPKQERFAREWVNNGGNSTAAYRTAYDCQNMSGPAIHTEASGLIVHPAVALRIVDLQQEAAEAASVSVDFVVAGLKRNAEVARTLETPQLAAGNRAYELLGKLHGLWKEAEPTDVRHLHVHVTGEGVRDQRLQEYSTDALEAWMAERAQPRVIESKPID